MIRPLASTSVSPPAGRLSRYSGLGSSLVVVDELTAELPQIVTGNAGRRELRLEFDLFHVRLNVSRLGVESVPMSGESVVRIHGRLLVPMNASPFRIARDRRLLLRGRAEQGPLHLLPCHENVARRPVALPRG